MPSLRHAFVALTLVASPLAAQGWQPTLSPALGDSGVDVEITRHPNGQLAKRVFRRFGQPHGLWQEWDADGRVTYLADWRDGLGEGVWTYFHPNGIVRSREWVTRDVWHGPSEGWHANGQKAFEGLNADGVKAGPFRYWREDGTPYGPAIELLAASRRVEPVLREGWPTPFNAWDLTLSPDLEVLFVGTGEDDGANRRILMRRWQRGVWQPLERAPFADSTAEEGSPVMSGDGAWVYFSSTRHVAREPDNPKRELYRASRASGWRTVQRVTFTPDYGEVSLTIARDGNGVLWSGRVDGSARTALYEVRLDTAAMVGGVTRAPRLAFVRDLSSLHTGDTSGEAFPVLSPDGSMLLFSNYDIGGAGTKEDVFVTRRTSAGWSTPERLSSVVNTPGDEKAVQLLDEGRVLLFSSPRGDGAPLYRLALPEPAR